VFYYNLKDIKRKIYKDTQRIYCYERVIGKKKQYCLSMTGKLQSFDYICRATGLELKHLFYADIYVIC